MQRSITPLFLSQSYQDAWDDYMRMLSRPDYAGWDYIILTASNEQQAEGFRAQLKLRQQEKMLPGKTHFAVIPDPEGKRVGSGGATLGVLRYIAQVRGGDDFAGLRILVIHSGGDSKRVPQYSALGKLFSPVPHELPNGRAATLFDELMIATAGVPIRMREGMLLLSGDVLLLFNALQIDFSGYGAAAISFKEHVQTGKNHGVFLRGEDGNVERFLHKQTEQTLRSCGAVNERDCVDIDTGAVIFSREMLGALYGLIATGGKPDDGKFTALVNETVRLSLYGDFLYPLATQSTLEEFYQEKPEGENTPQLRLAREQVWNALRPFRMKLLRLAPAKFIHFGTTREIMTLMSQQIDTYSYLGWDKRVNSSVTQENVAGYESVLSSRATCGEHCYLEVSYVHRGATVGSNTLLSYVDIHNETIPSNVVVHGLKQRDGRFVVRIYGIDDNPKAVFPEGMFLEDTLQAFLEKNSIDPQELWEGTDRSLWTARLYPACDTITEALAGALNVYDMAHGKGDVEVWRQSQRKSLQAGFMDADPHALIAWHKRMEELVRMDRLAKLIHSKTPASQAAQILRTDTLTPIQQEWVQRRLERGDHYENMRLHYYLGCALGGIEGEKHIMESFRCIRRSIVEDTNQQIPVVACTIAKDSHCVRLPLRVNWGGGWSDTPPYCNENGGTVLNAAVSLNGQLPVEVTLTKLADYKIVFDSRDLDAHGEFWRIEQLQDTGDPFDPFALQKAALLACGILPAEGGNLEEILARLGGGFRIQTEVIGVPKGSGLGTSSILAAACVKALFEFMGIPYTQEDLYGHVLAMEQIMSTGGGWQDQVGGLSDGIKYITTMPGTDQQIKVQYVTVPPTAMEQLQQRLVLIYTGQRRLARNLLRDVVGRYVGNEPDSLQALHEIQRVAALMRFELERGDIDAFARLMSYHWELSQKVDKGSTNTLIDQIFGAVEDLIDGRMICGAGGGGFLQAVLKKGVTRQQLQARLKSVFQDSDIDVWDCKLI